MDIKNVCSFSGHRNLKPYCFDSALLDRVICDLVKTGTKRFLCGMALGFDTAAAESVILLKEQYDIELVACLPCANQNERFSAANKLKYESILKSCDEVITLSPSYFPGCMHSRDRFMVDNSGVLVSFLRKNGGGTFYTVNYARRCGKKIIEL